MTLLVNKASNSGAQMVAPGEMPKKAGGRCWSICNGLSRTASLCKGMTGFVADKVSFIPELLSIQRESEAMKWPPLHIASNNGKERCVKFLLSCGADPNSGLEGNGISPLELACIAGHEPTARILIQSGANVNRVNNLGCSIADAIPLYNSEIVKLVLAEEVNWQSVNKIGLNALIYLKVARTKNWREIAQAIVNKDPKTAVYANEVLRRKRIGCLFDFGAQSTILRTNGTTIAQISLAGGNQGGKDFAVQIDKSLKEFSRLAPKTFLEPLLMIRDAFKQNSEVHESHYDLWNQGKPVILDFERNNGKTGHYIGVLIWKNYIVICDRGGMRRKNLCFYSFDTNLLTSNFFKTLEKDLGTFINKGNWDVFNPLQPKPIVPLDKKIILLNQQIGNCNYANKEGLILPFLILFALDGKENNVSDKEVDQTISEQGEVDKNRRSFAQMHVLRDYIEKSDKTVAGGIKPDFDLVANALPYHFSKEFHQKWLKKTYDFESTKMYPGETQPQVPGEEFARCAALHFAQGVYPKVHEKWKAVEAAFLEKAPKESRELYLKHIGKA